LQDSGDCAECVTEKNDRLSILKEGRNCFRIAKAERAAVLIDACQYYERLEQAFNRAKRSILIIGWDFDGRIKLCPDHQNCPPIGEFLRALVEAHPELEVYILVWSAAVIHASTDPMSLLVGAPWQNHPRIKLRLDRHHPLYAAHHQKMVVVDDALAFVGGIDLTVRRWDTCGHNEADCFRVDPSGAAYDPVHDVQMMVNGEAARVIAHVSRERWRIATGQVVKPAGDMPDLWPSDLEPDFTDVPIAIARTVPAWGQTSGVAEIAALTIDLLSAARHSIYIESQYFTASNMRRFIEKSLDAAHGPEIVVLVKRSSPGTLERFAMGANRDRLMRHMRLADRHNRLRFYYPVVVGKNGACEILVHSKILVVDDRILRVGSSNLNNRSMGLDTECDLAIEASNDNEARAIARLRDRLLGEHLGVAPDAIAQACVEHGSLIRAIEACRQTARGLRPFPEMDIEGPIEPVRGTALMDPAQPLTLLNRLPSP
jgi:phosphatidylserine/phosphatidylglycerophosphate/cardiolipin synthase-like enzyme